MSIIDLKTLGVDDEFYIGRKSKPINKKPIFYMVGRASMNAKQLSGISLLDLMLEFNKDQQRFFKLLLDCRNVETNCCDIRTRDISPTEVVKISRAYTALKELDLVKRVSKGTYMINPKALIPPMTYEQVQVVWDSL